MSDDTTDDGSFDALLNIQDGGPTLQKGSLYKKVGTGQNTSAKAIAAVENEMGDQQFRDRFGFIPTSLLRFDRNPEMMAALDDTSAVRGLLRSAIGGVYASTLRYSMYNLDAAKFFLDYYMPPKAQVLDPFMGRGSRALAAHLLGMMYVGFDTCTETIEVNRRLLAKHTGVDTLPPGWAFNHEDGTRMASLGVMQDVFDGCFTCPPYYDTEEYSGEPGDLSRMAYDQFDAAIEVLFTTLYRLVKPSGKHRPDIHPVVITVGTHRRGDQGLVDMDHQFQTAATKAGFILHDKVTTQNVPPGAGFTFRRNFGSGYVCKAHETTLVWVKR